MSLPACHREAGSDGGKALLRLAQFEGLRDAARAQAPARPRQAPVSAADDGRWGWGARLGGGMGGCETRSSRSPFSGPSFCKTPAQLAPWLPLLERRRGTRPCGEGTGQTSPAGVMGAPATAMGPGIADLTRARASHRRARRLRVWHVHPVDEGASPKMGATKKSERSPPQRGTGGSMKGFQNSRGKGLA